MKQRIIFFDSDGTVINSADQNFLNFNAEARKFGTKEKSFYDFIMLCNNGRFYEVMAEEGLTRDKFDLWNVDYHQNVIDNIDRYRPFDGMHQVLQGLSENSYVYIVSGNIKESLENIYKHYGLTDSIDGIFAHDLNFKGHFCKTESMKSIMAHHQGMPAFYVGDIPKDIHDARRAGAFSAAFMEGYFKDYKHLLLEAEPDIKIYSMEDYEQFF